MIELMGFYIQGGMIDRNVLLCKVYNISRCLKGYMHQ